VHRVLLLLGSTLLGATLLALAFGGVGATPLAPHATKSSPTYVILVHGFDPTLVPAYSVWTAGTDEYQQLVNAGYVVGIVSYYGTFTLTFSNGTTLTDPSYFGTTDTPIETIGHELGKMIQRAFVGQSGVHLDLIGHSMGGLVTEYMLEHVRFSGVSIDHVVFLGSPLNGAPVTALTKYLNVSGYQAAEMSQGSPFLTALHAWVPTARMNDPTTVWIVYAGDATPIWAIGYFGGANDGFVAVASAEDIPHDHTYLFPDLHVPELDVYDPGYVSYFEDQNVATEMLHNFADQY
jgi:pimeloyl-ACP methyl ester carboxylesterase